METLTGLRVIELAEALAGPYCAMLLADLGAEVIKIERPGIGDQSRRWGSQLPGGESAYFCATNRGKKSIALDFQSETGREILHNLLKTADVLICNIPREESLKKAGLDEQSLRARHPQLIVASITGYGRTGPSADRSGYDLVAQGESGLMSLTGTPETAPMRFPVPMADMTTGMYATIGILAALRRRDHTGTAQHLDLSLLECQSSYLTILAGEYFATEKAPKPIGNAHPSIVPYQVFQTADREVIIAVGSEKQWRLFCEVLGFETSLRDDPRFATNPARLAHRVQLIPLLQDRLSTIPSEELLTRLRQAEIPCGPINSVPDLLSDAHYLERQNVLTHDHPTVGHLRTLASPVRELGVAPQPRLPPPTLGQHTVEVLATLRGKSPHSGDAPPTP